MEEAEEEEEEEEAEPVQPITDSREISLTMKSLNPLLSCSLCKGYYRDATAIIECAHTCQHTTPHRHGRTHWPYVASSQSSFTDCPACVSFLVKFVRCACPLTWMGPTSTTSPSVRSEVVLFF